MNKEKKVVITGVNGQIGSHFARTLSTRGYTVYGVDLILDNIEPSKNIHLFQLDITSELEVSSFFDKVGSLYALINNAGIGVFTPFEMRTADEFKKVMDVNLLGTFLMSQSAVQLMKTDGVGKIINIGSIYGLKSSDERIYGNSGRNNSEVYSATKAGVINLTQYMAAHFAKYNIQINSLSPGGIFNSQTEDFVQNYIQKTPAGRMGSEDDLTDALCFLLADTNNYTNGQNITVDGGFTAW